MNAEDMGFGCLNIALIVFILGVIIFSFTGLHINTGDGQHTGYVTAVQRQGIIWKTWRAYIKTDVSSSQEDQYCVVDQNVVKQLQAAAESKERVTVTYFDWLFSGVANCAAEPDVIDGIK